MEVRLARIPNRDLYVNEGIGYLTGMKHLLIGEVGVLEAEGHTLQGHRVALVAFRELRGWFSSKDIRIDGTSTLDNVLKL
jgi:hypothetical protein